MGAQSCLGHALGHAWEKSGRTESHPGVNLGAAGGDLGAAGVDFEWIWGRLGIDLGWILDRFGVDLGSIWVDLLDFDNLF